MSPPNRTVVEKSLKKALASRMGDFRKHWWTEKGSGEQIQPQLEQKLRGPQAVPVEGR